MGSERTSENRNDEQLSTTQVTHYTYSCHAPTCVALWNPGPHYRADSQSDFFLHQRGNLEGQNDRGCLKNIYESYNNGKPKLAPLKSSRALPPESLRTSLAGLPSKFSEQ